MNGWTQGGGLAIAFLCLATMTAAAADPAPPAAAQTVAPDGTVHVPAHDVPPSPFATPEARQLPLAFQAEKNTGLTRADMKALSMGNNLAGMAKFRAATDEHHYLPLLRRAEAAYPADIEERTIGGVVTEIVTPKSGIAPKNAKRVLIELHGGSFAVGSARTAGLVDSVPMAGIGGIKVVAVDYRQAPEYKFPAASEDVASVYRELLKTYKPENIGIYGCSAGGILTGQALAWFQKEDLPRPGAVVFLGGGGGDIGDGDSGFISSSLMGNAMPVEDENGRHDVKMMYFKDIDMKQAIVSPVYTPAVLAKFPPSAFLTGTRDFAMSTMVYTHAQMVKAGLDARLHVWEGLPHCFHYHVEVPESLELYAVAVKFFDDHLGKR